MNNEELYQEALDKITELYGDDSVDKETAKSNLESLMGEIEKMIEGLEC